MSKKRFVSLVLILSLVIMSDQVSMVMAKDKTNGKSDKKTVVYTAIGDAIALGVGGEYISASDPLKGYDNYLVEKLRDENKKENVILNNVASRLDTSKDLLKKLMSDKTVIKAVEDADIITVSIGANNLILPVWPIFLDIFAGNISQEAGIAQIFGKTKEFQKGADQFKKDWPKIIERLEKLSPNAQIIVTTMYNPFLVGHPLYGLADGYINQINTEIKDNSYNYGYKVADVYSEIYNYDLSFYNYALGVYEEGYVSLIHQDLPDVVHPTPIGYQRISDLIYNQID